MLPDKLLISLASENLKIWRLRKNKNDW